MRFVLQTILLKDGFNLSQPNGTPRCAYFPLMRILFFFIKKLTNIQHISM